MILNKLQSANSIILDSVNATTNKQAAETFKNQLAALNTSTTKLEQLLNLMDALTKKDVPVQVMTVETRDTLKAAVDSCGEKTHDHSLDAGTVTALKNAVDLCQNALTGAWKDASEKQSLPIIESLTSLKSLLGDTKEADSLIKSLNSANQNMPSSIGAIDNYLSNVERGKKIIEGLHFDSDPEVKAFITQVQAQKATVDILTPHILKWLKDNHLTNKIKLRF